MLERFRDEHLVQLDVSYHLLKQLLRLAKQQPPSPPPPAARILEVLLLVTPPAKDVDPKQVRVCGGRHTRGVAARPTRL